MKGCDLDRSLLLGHLACDMLITLHNVVFVLLCSLIKGAAVQTTAGLIEVDTDLTEDQIYISHPSNSKSISG